jgi:hypothetical protein
MVLADSASPGGLGFLIVVIFFIVAVLIFIAMTRSMRRMRANVARGEFAAREQPEPPGPGRPGGGTGDPPASV